MNQPLADLTHVSAIGGFVRFTVFFLLLSLGAFAQTFRGDVAGVVTDASDAAATGAAVNLESPANGLKRATVPQANGAFVFAELPVGMYTLAVKKHGFETRKVDNVEISVSKITNITVQLGVAQLASLVEVSASPVSLETTSSSLAAVVDSRTVGDLPINGRDFRQMFELAPGVAAVNSPGNISVNGTRTDEINYQIDGVDNNDGKNIAFNQGGVGNSIPDVYLPIESIDQLSVQSDAESDRRLHVQR